MLQIKQQETLSLGKLAASLIENLAQELATDEGAQAPANWEDWCRTLFPSTFSSPFAKHHREYWEWIDSIREGVPPDPASFLGVWPRGGGKTTNAEMGVVRVGAKLSRRFVLYVRATQAKANESVQSIASKLESSQLSNYHPMLAQRYVGKYGHSKGWRMDMLRCANGFTILALGLDSSSRGVKIEDFRPDLIFVDDIDEKGDTEAKIKKKIDQLTSSILPAGSTDVAICIMQNMIHAKSIVTQLAQRKADFLKGIHVSGPHKAIEDLEYYYDGEKDEYIVTSGTPLWDGQDLPTVQRQINLWGPSVFKAESQHEVEEKGGIWDEVEFAHVTYDEIKGKIIQGQVWVDPAVTSTDNSDAMGIAAGALLTNKKICMMYFWERVTTPLDAMRRAILKALEYRFRYVGIETDQGGDTWRSVYKLAWMSILEDESIDWVLSKDDALERGLIDEEDYATLKGEWAMVKPNPDDEWEITKRPLMKSAKAGSGVGSKIQRNQKMLTDYELGRVVHMVGTHYLGESALYRFPNKPLDLADAMFWLWFKLSRLRTESRIG